MHQGAYSGMVLYDLDILDIFWEISSMFMYPL